MNTKKSIKSLSLTAATVIWTAAFAAGAFAQNTGADTAYVPFLVNVNATVKAVPSAGTTSAVSQVQITVSANTQTTMRIPLPKSTGVINRAQKQISAPTIVNNGDGKVTLNLPAQPYKNAEISLYTVNGKQILRQKVSASSAANGVSRPNAAPGAYLLSVTGTDGGKFTSRLSHSGGSLTLNVAFGGENITPARQLAKGAVAGEWTVTVSATGRVDSMFAFTPVNGTNPLKTITLRETAPVTPGLSAPANVTAAAASATSITVSWSAVSGVTEYYVYRAASATGTYSRVGITSSATYTNTGLTSGATYYYKVSAYNGSVESSQSPYVSATASAPAPTAPAVPAGVTATTESSGSITISWSAVSGTAGYYVYRSSTSATGAYSKVGTVTSESTSYTNTGLSASTTYYYKVSAYSGNLESAQSSYASATTPLAAPLNPPTSVTAVETSLSAITVSWSAVSGAIGYRVYRSTSADGTYEYVATTTSTSYTNTGLPINVPYYYKVSVNNNAGEGPISSSYASAKVDVISGTFVDYRDDRTYRYITVLGKRWMAENLNYATASGSWCYSGTESNCVKYGRLYDWATATTICPSGWHLPSRQEWGDLAIAAGGTGTYGADGTAGTRLKSTSGWNNKSDGSSGNGTDAYGFSALPGGYRRSNGSFDDAGDRGNWWTATESGSSSAYHRDMNLYYAGSVREDSYDKSLGYSVRCFGD